ncbi:MFS transporter [Lentzea alba]|uniref:MFS transporter n=1 Tax=Lentzea alba TaxID=2714351 RepID=UPI0039BF5F3F
MAALPALRKNKQFQLLWLGGAVSQFGSELTKLAMPLLVLALTSSPSWAGIVVGVRTAAYILTQMPAGVWVDRWDRRRTLVSAQLTQAIASAVLATAIVTGWAFIWVFLIAGLVDGVCAAFIDPSRATAIRGVVDTSQLRLAYTQEESRSHAARLIGPPLGGLLFGLGRTIPFVVDAITFFVATLLTFFAKVPRRPAGEQPPAASTEHDDAPKPSMRQELAEAVSWLWRQRGLRNLCGAVLALNFLGAAFMIPLIVLVRERGGSGLVTGIVLAGVGIGGLGGALLANRIGSLLPAGKLLLAILGIFGAALLAMALPFGAWWPLIPLMCISLTTPSINVVINVVISRLVPEQMLGRMESVLTVSQMGIAPLGPVIGGALAAVIGGANTVVVIGLVLLLVCAVAAMNRELRGFTGEEPELDGDQESSLARS